MSPPPTYPIPKGARRLLGGFAYFVPQLKKI
jgi:hypothetical protein